MNLDFYVIDNDYIEYLRTFDSHVYQNKHNRKYIGIVFEINNFHYFAPLSSHKEKHDRMKESVDFIKLKDYGVINLNNMIPVPLHLCQHFIINSIEDSKYKDLMRAEYRIIKPIAPKIIQQAKVVYREKTVSGNITPLSRRCYDFKMLEEACEKYPD